MFDRMKNDETVLWHVDFRDSDKLPSLQVLYLIKGLGIIVAIAVLGLAIALTDNGFHIWNQNKALAAIERETGLLKPQYQKAISIGGEFQKMAKWFEALGVNCSEHLNPVVFLAALGRSKPATIEFSEISFERQLQKKVSPLQAATHQPSKRAKKAPAETVVEETAAYFTEIQGVVKEETETAAIRVVEDFKKTIQALSVYENISQENVRIVELKRFSESVNSMDANDILDNKTELFNFTLTSCFKNPK